MRPWIATVIITAALLVSTIDAHAQSAPPAPPTNLVATDHPWDNGTRIDLSWSLSRDDATVAGYVIRKKADGDAEFSRVEQVPAGTSKFTVPDLDPKHSYLFEVAAVGTDNRESPPVMTNAPVTPRVEWFDGARTWFLLILLIFCGAVLAFIMLARRGMPLRIRQIAGLRAVDEAVGRATEMGRPCLFVPGIQDMNDIQTIAGITVLARVAKTAAEYDARLEVPNVRSLVMTSARETVETAYLTAGRPDAFNPDSIYYVTDEQFGYVAYLQGWVVRERPAACFYMGSFFAEALILAEMGNGVGAIQIAGTAQIAQLPFFVAACDYTLIGEEFFAASAYLSGEPEQLGSLKGQDVGKVIVAVVMVIGVGAATIASVTHSRMFQSFVDYLIQTVLT